MSESNTQFKRKTNRLPSYDYSQNGAYFVTICVKDEQNLLFQNVGANSIRPSVPVPLSTHGLVLIMQ
jgi:putative transposase